MNDLVKDEFIDEQLPIKLGGMTDIGLESLHKDSSDAARDVAGAMNSYFDSLAAGCETLRGKS